MNKLILDLRDNPGGIVEQAVGVASNFVPPNSTIVSYTEQDGKVDQYTAQGRMTRFPSSSWSMKIRPALRKSSPVPSRT